MMTLCWLRLAGLLATVAMHLRLDAGAETASCAARSFIVVVTISRRQPWATNVLTPWQKKLRGTLAGLLDNPGGSRTMGIGRKRYSKT